MTKYIDAVGADIDLTGLPAELLNELSCIPDEFEKQVINLLPTDGSAVSLDAILVGLYREHGILKKRRFLQNKLYRMEEVETVEDKKGHYQLHPALVDGEPK